MGMAVCPTANDLQLSFERTVEMTKVRRFRGMLVRELTILGRRSSRMQASSLRNTSRRLATLRFKYSAMGTARC